MLEDVIIVMLYLIKNVEQKRLLDEDTRYMIFMRYDTEIVGHGSV